MGNRLSKIYTRTGDDGSTGLAGGERLPKHHPRIEAMGDVDELNCQLGVLLAQPLPDAVRRELLEIQHDLFDIGGELAMPDTNLLPATRIAELERAIDAMNEGLPALREFILPGGGAASAQCHVCRAVCRRAERRLIALCEGALDGSASRVYLNRLSDWLFVCARALARADGVAETLWRGRSAPAATP